MAKRPQHLIGIAEVVFFDVALIELNTMDQYVPGPPRPFDMRVAMGEVAQAKVPVEAGEEVVRATVMARWQFVSGSR